ncbi:serine hydrolase [Mesorhizobium sp. WSM3868]|uniref:serine hydrolase domain-containing protein n=1 Tax=Mesorhizobium sp. WSM3868 TaxID=2029405 RepID=UPI0015CE9034|nr:serine hydrolase [Mesorhizobium sp. WSM3868]
MVNFQDGKQSVNDFLERSFTDGFLVLHRGRIVFERYMNGLVPHRQHILYSATKSFTGTLAGILADKGLLDVTKPITHYLPELAATAYRGATVQQVLDMASGVYYDEEWHEGSHMQKALYAAWYHQRVSGWPRTIWELILTLDKAERPHGSLYNYRSIETDVLSFVLERASGMSQADLMSQQIWAPMGAEEDAYCVVDDAGFADFAGGLCVTMRDLGRFGLLLIEGGARDGRQIVPHSWINEILEGRGAPLGGSQLWGGAVRSYHNFWRTDRDHRALWASGFGGQLMYVEPDAEFVAVKLSHNWPKGHWPRGGHALSTRAAMLAIRDALI